MRSTVDGGTGDEQSGIAPKPDDEAADRGAAYGDGSLPVGRSGVARWFESRDYQ